MNEQDASLQAITTVQRLTKKPCRGTAFSCCNGAACSSRAGGGLRRSRAVPLRPSDEACSDDGKNRPTARAASAGSMVQPDGLEFAGGRGRSDG
jgi:hypothetical protein